MKECRADEISEKDEEDEVEMRDFCNKKEMMKTR